MRSNKRVIHTLQAGNSDLNPEIIVFFCIRFGQICVVVKDIILKRKVWVQFPGPGLIDTPPLRHFFGFALPRCYAAEMGPASRYTFWRNPASVIKVVFLNNIHSTSNSRQVRWLKPKIYRC